MKTGKATCRWICRQIITMNDNEKLTAWAAELQSLAQAGLYYSKDRFDLERFERIRQISAEMMALQTELSIETVKDLFCADCGYQTPKLDTRAAVFAGEKVLLVQERDGRWALPGGWVDFNLSIKENTIKEVKEEAGLDAVPQRLIAIHDRNKHNPNKYPFGVAKVFVLCSVTGGKFQKNNETIDSGYFDVFDLPSLAVEKNTERQILMCFEASLNPDWKPVFD